MQKKRIEKSHDVYCTRRNEKIPIETITIIDQAPVYHPFTFESSYVCILISGRTSQSPSFGLMAGWIVWLMPLILKMGQEGFVYSYSQNGRLKIFTILAQDKEGVEVQNAEYNGTFNGSSKNFFVNIQNSDIIFNTLVMKNSLSFNRYNTIWQLGVLDLNTTDRIFSFRNDFEFMINNNLNVLSGFELENRYTYYEGNIPLLELLTSARMQGRNI